MSEENYNQLTKENYGHDDSSVVKIRLDPDGNLAKLEAGLLGAESNISYDDNGQPFIVEGKSNPLCNSEGRRAILNYVSGIINTQGLQAFFKDVNHYDEYCKEVFTRFTYFLFINRVKWDIKTSNLSVICALVKDRIRITLTSAIGGKMLDSVSSTVRSVESSGGKSGIASFFGKKE